MERTIWSLNEMSELRIDAHWTRNFWLAMLDIDGQWWCQALSALAAEHAKDLLLGAVRGARIVAGPVGWRDWFIFDWRIVAGGSCSVVRR